MYVFKGTFRQYQPLRQSVNALSKTPWCHQISSSSIHADLLKEGEPSFGLLSDDPSSEFHEGKKKDGRSSKPSLYVKSGQTGFKSSLNTYSKLYKRRENSRVQKTASPDNLINPEVEEQCKSVYEIDKTLDKWVELKNVDQNSLQKLSQSLIQDDNEEEYFKYLPSEPNMRLKLFNERFERRRNNSGSSDRKLDVVPAAGDTHKQAFGQLSHQKDLYEDESGDEGDERQRKYEEAKNEKRHTPAYYGFRMKKLCKERKLLDALKILDEEMPAVHVKPDRFCYQVLINACGRVGYTKKAFQLFNQMKKRGIIPHHVSYTGLFNACSNSPWPTKDGLRRALKLRKQLKEKGYVFNAIVCHAMIKAFGRCGDIKTSFLIVDEMLDEGLLVNVETINFMLQACISDKEAGFRHALMVWRKMRELKLRPDEFTCNLLIRCVSDCKSGDPLLISQILQGTSKSYDHIINTNEFERKLGKRTEYSNNSRLNENANKFHHGNLEESPPSWQEAEVQKVEVLQNNSQLERMKKGAPDNRNALSLLPDLLGRKLTLGNAIALTSLDKAEYRLALLGGPVGFLKQMSKDRVTPSIKTVTQMLESLPANTEVEESLLQSMKNLGLSPDTQFCNMLIRKRSFRYDYEAAKDVLDLMQEHYLKPDLITFGCLAFGCSTLQSALEFLENMDAVGFRPNLEIMASLVSIGIARGDYFYILEMLRAMHDRNIHPNEKLLTTLENVRAKARQTLMDTESGRREATKEDIKKLDFVRLFMMEYKNWLKGTKIEIDDHPWAQYQSVKATG